MLQFRKIWLVFPLLLLYGIFLFSGTAQAQPLAAPQPEETRQKNLNQNDSKQIQSTLLQPSDVYSLPPDKLEKANHLRKLRNVLHFVSALWSLVLLWLILSTRLGSWLSDRTKGITKHEWIQGLLFLPALLTLLDIGDLPLSLYHHHLALAYGLSVQHWGSWFLDWGKSLLLTLLFGTGFLMLFRLIVKRSPQRYWLWFWIVTLPIFIATVFIWPLLVEPLFDHFEPLAKSNPALVQELQKVVARTGTEIPPERMFLMKASEKSAVINAYVTGLGASKRVVVWDTTIQKLPVEDILFVFGHESGHYVLNHIWKGMAATMAALFFLYLCGAFLVNKLLLRFGGSWRIADQQAWAAIPLFLLTITALSFIAEPAFNTYSRMQEHAADVYGQEAIHGIVSNPQQIAVHTFQTMGEIYLDDPNPNPWLEFWIYDHPSIKNRVAFAAHYNPWTRATTPRYFTKGTE